METNKIKDFLKLNNDYSKNSLYKDPHEINYINLTHVETWGHLRPANNYINQIGNQSYVSIKHVKDLLSEQNNVRKVEISNFLEAFGLIETLQSDGVKIINSTKIPLSKQYCFAYSIYNYLKTNYPNLNPKMEYEIFKKLGITPHAIKGPRIDIYVESLKLAIEFDEDHHNSYDNKFSDSERECFLTAYGLNVIRCSETDEIWSFIKDKLIPNLKFLDIVYANMYAFGSKLIDDLVESGCGSKEKIKLLVEEQMLDIIECKPVGEQIRNISLNNNIFEWLQIEDQCLKNEIYEMIEELESDEPTESIEQNDYLLSPNAFLSILDNLDGKLFPELYLLRKAGHKIRHRLLKLCASGFEKIKSITEKQNSCIPMIAEYHYSRGCKDTDAELRLKEKEILKVKSQLEFYKNFLEENIPMYKTKLKNPIKDIKNFILESGCIISEELDIIYTGNSDDKINIDDIKELYGIRSRQNKIKKSLSKCIENIRSRLGINKNELTYQSSKYIFKCTFKITFQNKKLKEYTDPKYIENIKSHHSKPIKKKLDVDFILEEESSDDSEF